MKTVFVTGANGLLGTNLVNLLLANGYIVKGLVRKKSRYKGNQSIHLQLVEGNLFDDFTRVLPGVDYVIHVAAITSQNLLDFAEYWKTNGNATIQLFHAAAQCKVKRFVFVSTANTLGPGSFDKPGDENDPISEPFRSSFYAQSKEAAENHLLSNKHIMEAIIVNPTFMLGAYDTKPSSGRLILLGWKKKVILYPPGGKNFVHVEDVAGGIVKCIENGRNGEKYIFAGENLSYKEFFIKLNMVANQKPVMIKLPGIILLAIGVFGELLRGLRIKTNLSLVNMRILCTTNYYSANKSITELGLKYRPIESAIADALNYFKMVKMMSLATALFFLLMGYNTNSFAQSESWSTMEDIRQVTELASATTWRTIRQDKGVTLSSRWLTFGDSLQTREISSHFVVDADIQNVLLYLVKAEKMLAWHDGLRSLHILKDEGTTWITHIVYDIPFPLSQQDLTAKNVMITEGQKVIILLSALPDYIEPIKNITRQRLYFGKWELKPQKNGTTEVRFSVLSFSKSNIPRLVRDPIIQNKLFNSFVRLKELSSL